MALTPRYPQAILASCKIPWDENSEILEDVFRRSVQSSLQYFNHVYIFGTAGEGYAVDTSQFKQIVNIFYEETRGDDVYSMVGLIGMSTPIILEKLHYAYGVGFRTFQISFPSWGVLTDIEVMTFFKDVCSVYSDAKFLHYNLPRTGRVLEASDYRPLAGCRRSQIAKRRWCGTL